MKNLTIENKIVFNYTKKQNEIFAAIENAVRTVYNQPGFDIDGNFLRNGKTPAYFVIEYNKPLTNKEKGIGALTFLTFPLYALLSPGGSDDFHVACQIKVYGEKINIECGVRQFDNYAERLSYILAEKYKVNLVLSVREW